jgi:hypothetical protein
LSAPASETGRTYKLTSAESITAAKAISREMFMKAKGQKIP